MLIAQPAEETISGARAMVEDGLYTRFPKPDYAVAFHVSADMPAGRIVGHGVQTRAGRWAPPEPDGQ